MAYFCHTCNFILVGYNISTYILYNIKINKLTVCYLFYWYAIYLTIG